jgi:hypothetical protein
LPYQPRGAVGVEKRVAEGGKGPAFAFDTPSDDIERFDVAYWSYAIRVLVAYEPGILTYMFTQGCFILVL